VKKQIKKKASDFGQSIKNKLSMKKQGDAKYNNDKDYDSFLNN
jgi:hypothetical protein